MTHETQENDTDDEISSIPIRRKTLRRTRQLKRGGESWDQLVEKMADQYEPSDQQQ